MRILPKIICPFCGFEFKNTRANTDVHRLNGARKNLETHIVHCKHNPDAIPYICHCGKQFNNRRAINGHKSHCGIERPKKYKSKGRKTRISRIISSKCRFCDYINEDNRKLGGHMGACKLNPKNKDIIERRRRAATGKIPSIESREKISRSRIKYLEEHPDKVPYLINHSSKESNPEKIFREALIKQGISGWVQEYRNGIYSYDFAFLECKLDVEIDGGTHKSEKVLKIDKRRDLWSVEQGWKVLRFNASLIKKDVNNCIEQLKLYL